MNIRSLLTAGRKQLAETGIGQARLDAELLLATVLGQDNAYMIAHADDSIGSGQEQLYREFLRERSSGKPIQYIRGRQEFWGRDFVVGPSVLIPRPETELIVERALRAVAAVPAERRTSPLKIADIGTGSGCLAVTLAAELESAQVWATDISLEALDMARANARRHGVESRVAFLEGDLGAPLLKSLGEGAFALVVSNPPYGGTRHAGLFERQVLDFEPHAALFGGPEGTETIERLLPQAHQLLTSGGLLLLEIGVGQAVQVTAMLACGWTDLEVLQDLQGIPRCVCCRKASREGNENANMRRA